MNTDNKDAIVLLAKQPGLTSFSSLRNVKKAMNTNKVGHTGTLDSFAEGLLVVCTGHYTKLCGQITAFDKTYKAVLHFGKETDTCEYTGNIIREAGFPTEKALRKAVEKWTGDIMQKPPLFSAIHVDGKRASDLVREGKDFDIPARPVKVFSAEIQEIKYVESSREINSRERLVEYALIEFSVSKGTYIRSLARDIAESCGSAAYLTGLFRTKVGNFLIEDAAGFDLLPEFNIHNTCKREAEYKVKKESLETTEKKINSEEDLKIQKEILEKNQDVTSEIAELCGFETIFIKNALCMEAFKHGKPLKSSMFHKSLWDYPNDCSIAVFKKDDFFDEEVSFLGLINKDAAGKVSYGFVIG
ncbi:MAG: tRNA pseudouridine(55) synthase TruB [Treponema sp.]|nr:tRNA pseudouridine(55) synthase TruB [Treponema sp.]